MPGDDEKGGGHKRIARCAAAVGLTGPRFSRYPLPVDRIERALAALLYGSRWLLAPCYVGLVAALVGVLVEFFRELVQAVIGFSTMGSSAVILAALKLIDLLLVGNLVLIMLFAGVETLAARRAEAARPRWMGKLDFGGLKLKVMASIAAIASVHLLETFFDVEAISPLTISWEIAILLVFAVAAVLLAWMDRLAGPHE